RLPAVPADQVLLVGDSAILCTYYFLYAAQVADDAGNVADRDRLVTDADAAVNLGVGQYEGASLSSTAIDDRHNAVADHFLTVGGPARERGGMTLNDAMETYRSYLSRAGVSRRGRQPRPRSPQ